MPKSKSKPELASTFMAFRAEPDMARAMLRLQARDGISISEQIRRALAMWLATKRVYAKKEQR